MIVSRSDCITSPSCSAEPKKVAIMSSKTLTQEIQEEGTLSYTKYTLQGVTTKWGYP